MSAAESEPRRLTPTERLHEVTMAAMGRKPVEPESSVTISRNARGVFQFEVTVRGPDVDACYLAADKITEQLIYTRPYPEANGGTAE